MNGKKNDQLSRLLRISVKYLLRGIRGSIIFAGLFIFAGAVFALFYFLWDQFLLPNYGLSEWVWILSAVLTLLFLYDPLKLLLFRLTEHQIFQRHFDFAKILREASREIIMITSLRELSRRIIAVLVRKARTENAAIYVRSNQKDQFKLEGCHGYKHETRPPMIVEGKNSLIFHLSKKQGPVSFSSVELELKRTKSESERTRLMDVLSAMERLRAEVLVPSFLGGFPTIMGGRRTFMSLRGILVIGRKKSEEVFYEEDLDMLAALAQEHAIAFENARLYDEAINKSRELGEINKELEGAQGRLIRALDDTEVANKKLRDAQMQLIHEQKMATLGRLASSVGHEVNNPLTILSMNVSRAILKYRKNPDLKVNEILDIFQKMEQNIGRIKAVVNTLTGLLKKSQHGKFEPLSLKLILEETLPLVQFQTYLENLTGTEVEFQIPATTPLIKGDLERLQEVFLNLFINAYHAMTGKKDRRIVVTANVDPTDSNFVVIEFADNGSGMSDEIMKKVFTYGYTTKPAGKGSGIGLYMCRYIVELHGGEIKVRSKLGEGTTFVLRLPAYYEPVSSTAASVVNS